MNVLCVLIFLYLCTVLLLRKHICSLNSMHSVQIPGIMDFLCCMTSVGQVILKVDFVLEKKNLNGNIISVSQGRNGATYILHFSFLHAKQPF